MNKQHHQDFEAFLGRHLQASKNVLSLHEARMYYLDRHWLSQFTRWEVDRWNFFKASQEQVARAKDAWMKWEVVSRARLHERINQYVLLIKL